MTLRILYFFWIFTQLLWNSKQNCWYTTEFHKYTVCISLFIIRYRQKFILAQCWIPLSKYFETRENANENRCEKLFNITVNEIWGGLLESAESKYRYWIVVSHHSSHFRMNKSWKFSWTYFGRILHPSMIRIFLIPVPYALIRSVFSKRFYRRIKTILP